MRPALLIALAVSRSATRGVVASNFCLFRWSPFPTVSTTNVANDQISLSGNASLVA